MNARTPETLLAKPATKTTRNTAKATKHMKEASILAGIFGELSSQLEAGDVKSARKASHQAHALLEVLSAMDTQDEYPELASPKCDERQQAARAWKRLMRPDTATTTELRNHFESRRFSYIRLEPLPPLPEPKPRATYKGGIYQTVFLPDDPKLAREQGLPESYTFRHGVTNSGFTACLYRAMERKLRPTAYGEVSTRNMLDNGMANPNNYMLVHRERWGEGDNVCLRYSIHSTTDPVTAELLAAARGKAKRKAAAKKG